MQYSSTLLKGSCALQGIADDSKEEGPAAAHDLFKDDDNTDLCVLCREMMMTVKKKHQLQPLSCLRMTATQICVCYAAWGAACCAVMAALLPTTCDA